MTQRWTRSTCTYFNNARTLFAAVCGFVPWFWPLMNTVGVPFTPSLDIWSVALTTHWW